MTFEKKDPECTIKLSAYWTCAKGTYGCIEHKPFDTSHETNAGKQQRLVIPVKIMPDEPEPLPKPTLFNLDELTPAVPGEMPEGWEEEILSFQRQKYLISHWTRTRVGEILPGAYLDEWRNGRQMWFIDLAPEEVIGLSSQYDVMLKGPPEDAEADDDTVAIFIDDKGKSFR